MQYRGWYEWIKGDLNRVSLALNNQGWFKHAGAIHIPLDYKVIWIEQDLMFDTKKPRVI